MSVPALMLTEMKGENRIHPTFDVTLAGTKYLFSASPIASESEGLYTPDIVSWGTSKRNASHISYSLERPRSKAIVNSYTLSPLI